MYDSLPVGERLWVCTRCRGLVALRSRGHFLEAKVADLEKEGRKSEKRVAETFRNTIELAYSSADGTSADMEKEGGCRGGRSST